MILQENTQKKKVDSGKGFFSVLISDSKNDLQLIYLFIFLGFVLYLTIVCNDFFLKWAEGLSLFLTTGSYFAGCMRFAGGLLIYAGTFLTQFFHYPALGGSIFIVLLLLTQYLSLVAFHIPRKYYPLSFIPGFMLLLSITQLGYVWITLKSPGYLFSNVLGVIAFLVCFTGYRKICHWGFRSIAMFAIVTAGYPLFGFYALFTGLICLLYELTLFFRDWDTLHFVPVAVAIVMIGLSPQLYFYLVHHDMQRYYLYTAALPRFLYSRKELILWLPFIVLFFSFVLFLLLRQESRGNGKTGKVVSLVIFIAAVVMTYRMSYRDENFRAEVKMCAAMEENDWQKVTTIAGNLRDKPTQSIILNYHLALLMQGQKDRRNFNLNDMVNPNSIRPEIIMITIHMNGQPFLYKTGELNDCYRWCMEDLVGYGMRISYLKYMVKCAIMNEEYELARKYNALISKTLFYKDWARKYQGYIDQPDLVKEDEEMRAIRYVAAHGGCMRIFFKLGLRR